MSQHVTGLALALCLGTATQAASVLAQEETAPLQVAAPAPADPAVSVSTSLFNARGYLDPYGPDVPTPPTLFLESDPARSDAIALPR